jgi:putative ABC transport system permease protein
LIALSRLDYQRGWMTEEPSAIEISLKPGVSPQAGRRAVQAVLASHPGLQARTAAESTTEADDVLRQGLSSLGQISTLVLIIGALAIAASLSTAIWQRRVRLAAMRIWGFDRMQLWFSLLVESTILLTIGCTVGAAFGLYAHALGTRYLRLNTGFPAPFSVGSVQIVLTILLVGGISLAVVALPGMRAAQVPPTVGFQE